MKLSKIRIKQYRSILDMELDLNTNNDFISICGQNNTGKTNVLRALRLFFKPDLYIAKEDCPYYKHEYTRGANMFPIISLTFLEDNGDRVTITRKFNLKELKSTEGTRIANKKSKIALSEKECCDYISNIKFYFIESVNISIPDLLNDLTEDLFDVEYGKSVFKGKKAKLKKAFDEYVDGLNNILNSLSAEITPMFHEFEEHWDISFNLESDVKKFRDLVSADINFNILDGSNNEIDSKGAGLQRLAFILLHIRIIEKMTNKNVLFVIDEPDVFLHPGMQKKLHKYLKQLNGKAQTIITTHSKVFIDTYKLENVFLLELKVTEKYTKRKDKIVKVLSTKNVELSEEHGSKKIKQYLGIDDEKIDVLPQYTVLVEGESDKKYISEMMKFFELEVPNIIAVNGADNMPLRLEYFNSFEEERYLPEILALLDNDSKGREVYKKILSNIEKEKYKNIQVKLSFVPNFLGEIQDGNKLANVQTNNEIEDFVYPSIICFLINQLLKKKKMKAISEKNILRKIVTPAFKYKGILDLCESEKNTNNLETGNSIVFTQSNKATDNIKTSLANSFNVESDFKIINMLKEANENFPEVKCFLEKISNNTI